MGVEDGITLADLRERYGKWQTVASPFYRWQKNGLWDGIFAQLQQMRDRDGQLEWEVHYLDGSVIRAHQQAAGKKVRQQPRHQGSGTS